MNQTTGQIPPKPVKASHKPVLFLILTIIVVVAGVGIYQFRLHKSNSDSAHVPESTKPKTASAEKPTTQNRSLEKVTVTLPESKWKVSGLKIEPVATNRFEETVRLTGKVSLNEDKIAHIYPMVEGSVDSVAVGLGQVVKANDVLVVVHSREIGQAKLELYQSRLQHEMAVVKDKIQQEIATNTRPLLVALRKREPITEIEERFRSRSMGNYRERLLMAYASYLKSDADVERLEEPTKSGAVAFKQLHAAKSSRNADLAAFQARIEQIEYELKTSLLLSSQSVKEAATRVAVAATSLRILGCDEAEIQSINPEQQGAKISHYFIRSPINGTIISKDVTLKEQIRPQSQIFSIADLSTVWITADIYEKNIPLLSSLAGKPVRVFNEAWPDRSFQARIFYTGEIMDEKTRTVSMRAIADNPDHLLKPGMFVNIEFESGSDQELVTIPLSALQEHEGKSFVFVYTGGDQFEKRLVKPGKQNETSSVILEGLNPGERVVLNGGFILKSKMLEDLMGEE
ncbi:Cobalt-zinc-cadmium resistance protein CzcB [Gimesia panareensis]|uniref:Cobalt-zinc-cadmium resistance protein CzcB n=1 Tax=Gimesia panareensis TaxID=2527978 RepID=A0A517Q7M9_9PLAN|nr:efflux RND transporter periplasmic adaptor subunit [Gimesia panareensis]QDT27630.1 Cobalt-zinc-cadmium resistance protein CzcB [Gimesia panareensis]